jgi:hypothetical protein
MAAVDSELLEKRGSAGELPVGTSFAGEGTGRRGVGLYE